jgi:UDP-N-acetylmuramate dehydrogenase
VTAATAGPAVLEGLAHALGTLALRHRPLGALTTYRAGGSAALMAEPAHTQELLAVARAYRRAGAGVPVLVIGRGSNLLVADAGFPGLVVALGPGFEAIATDGDEVVAGGAVSLPVLARRTAAAGLRGLEWAVGVPGSVGGAVRMNAGGHGSDTAATLRSCRIVDLGTATEAEVPVEDLALGYRSSALRPDQVVVAALHRLTPGDPGEAAAAISEIVRWRRENQPGGSNAGSVFTNPPGDSAGRLIEACGLKGSRVGTAEVSTKHANFIQCDDGGSADDVARLIEQVRRAVRVATGVTLTPEVQVVGFAAAEPGRPATRKEGG